MPLKLFLTAKKGINPLRFFHLIFFVILQAFMQMEGLERLYLQYNNLTAFPSNLPRTLRDLRIDHNKIEKVLVSIILLLCGALSVIVYCFGRSSQTLGLTNYFYCCLGNNCRLGGNG